MDTFHWWRGVTCNRSSYLATSHNLIIISRISDKQTKDQYIDCVTLGLGHSASKPKGLFICYTGCLPRVSMPSIGMQLVLRLDFSKVLSSNLNHCASGFRCSSMSLLGEV